MDIMAMVLSVGLCAILLVFLVVNLFIHKENQQYKYDGYLIQTDERKWVLDIHIDEEELAHRKSVRFLIGHFDDQGGSENGDYSDR